MTSESPVLVLGSGSPRRRELLAHLLAPSQFIVDPPADFVEPTCDHPQELGDVEAFARDLAVAKAKAVREQRADSLPTLAADTVVVAFENEKPVVLGKPPAGPEQETTMRHWWCQLLSGRSHFAITGVALLDKPERDQAPAVTTCVATTEVRFVQISASMADWYLSTGEGLGKAGGYAIQGLGSLFVDRVKGSFSNVIGLPVWETCNLLNSAGIDTSQSTNSGSSD